MIDECEVCNKDLAGYKEMEDKKITWEFITCEGYMDDSMDYWYYSNYFIQDRSGCNDDFILYRNHDKLFSSASLKNPFRKHDEELFSSGNLKDVFKYAEKLIKDPKHKEMKKFDECEVCNKDLIEDQEDKPIAWVYNKEYLSYNLSYKKYKISKLAKTPFTSTDFDYAFSEARNESSGSLEHYLFYGDQDQCFEYAEQYINNHRGNI